MARQLAVEAAGLAFSGLADPLEPLSDFEPFSLLAGAESDLVPLSFEGEESDDASDVEAAGVALLEAERESVL
jgi:hypothetical protein